MNIQFPTTPRSISEGLADAPSGLGLMNDPGARSATAFEVARHSVQAGASLDPASFADLRRSAILEGCKWDPQVGDVSTLAPFPIILAAGEWRRLSEWSEGLAAETLATEQAVLERPELLGDLSLPRSVRAALSQKKALTPAAVRVMRFDFHPTMDGWRISEVNSDVPGGFTESTHFTDLMARHFPGLHSAGRPASRWADALMESCPAQDTGAVIGMLAAPGYMEDQQIMAFLARELQARGGRPVLSNPAHLQWRDGLAFLPTRSGLHRCAALVRFYQGEWLPRLGRRCGWPHFFRGGQSPVTNPGHAVISESKRLPLIWNRLDVPLPRWRALLPETRALREVPWQNDDGWIVKLALSNTGDDVGFRDQLSASAWTRLRWEIFLQPNRWLAQRRFESLPLETPLGPRHVCIGIFTINGSVAGAYVRLSPRPLIDYAAVDAALLIKDDQ